MLGVVRAEDLAQALHSRSGESVDLLAGGRIVSIPAESTLLEARDRILGSDQTDFPVTNSANQIVGYLCRQDLPAGFLDAGNELLASTPPRR